MQTNRTNRTSRGRGSPPGGLGGGGVAGGVIPPPANALLADSTHAIDSIGTTPILVGTAPGGLMADFSAPLDEPWILW